MENKVLAAAIQSKEAYVKIINLAAEGMSDKAKIVLQAVGRYYDKDIHAVKVDKEILIQALEREHPKHAEIFKQVVEGLPHDEVSPPNVVQSIIQVKLDKVKDDLAQAFTSSSDKEGPIGDLLAEWQRLRDGKIEQEEEGSEVLIGASLAELFADRKKEKIKLLPKVLNAYLDGGASRQEHIVIFGRPEIAKTTFIINMMYGFILQGLKILYVNNEDPSLKILVRFFQRATGLSKEQVENDPQEADRQMKAKGHYENFVFFSVPDGTLKEIESLMVTHQPDVVIIDQMRNINHKGDNRTMQLENISRETRKLGRKHNSLMISITQAGESAENKKVLGQTDVDWNNTGIQGTADLLIGIGADEEMKQTGKRILSFSKNKISDRHDPLPVLFNTRQVKVQ